MSKMGEAFLELCELADAQGITVEQLQGEQHENERPRTNCVTPQRIQIDTNVVREKKI